MARRRSQRRSKSQHKSRKVRGGAWYNPLSWFEEEEPSYFSPPVEEKPLLQSVGEGAQTLMQKADQKILEASNAISSGVSSASQNVQDALNTDVPLVASETTAPEYTQPAVPVSAFGGRRRRQQRAGKGGLGLAYYATPVDGMKVAEPTYWEEYKGGAKRSRSKRRTQRKSRSKGRRRSRARGRSQRRARA
jgi:hypothetical protein